MSSLLSISGFWKRMTLIVVFAVLSMTSHAQFKRDYLLRSADTMRMQQNYVLSIQRYNALIASQNCTYRAWLGRGFAKFSLDDFVGAEKDVTEAIRLNPFDENEYRLRGNCRYNRKDYKGAAEDYTTGLGINPSQQDFWSNRALSYYFLKDYVKALQDCDTVMKHWKSYSRTYLLKSQILVSKKDTDSAIVVMRNYLKIEPKNEHVWEFLAFVQLQRQKWSLALGYLDEVIKLNPKNQDAFVNRGLCYYQLNKLGKALTDYDQALVLNPNDFKTHYNRGLLRITVGDYNRAVTDFDFIVKKEPDNWMAIYNRALLLDQIGDLKGAVRDYSTVIRKFPNFWKGLLQRARCYRLLGMNSKAELDEFRVQKANMDKTLGIQARWSKKKLREVRKQSEIDMDKYDNIVVEDKAPQTVEYEGLLGKVQQRVVQIEFLPMFRVGYQVIPADEVDKRYFNMDVEAYNHEHKQWPVELTTTRPAVTQQVAMALYDFMDALSEMISNQPVTKKTADLYVQRAIAQSTMGSSVQAAADVDNALAIDGNHVIANWMKAVFQSEINANAKDVTQVQNAAVMAFFDMAIRKSPENAVLYYNRGCENALRGYYDSAISDYKEAIKKNSNFAEAYYNKGIAEVKSNRVGDAIQDLSKAGELGLYDAYSIIRQVVGK